MTNATPPVAMNFGTVPLLGWAVPIGLKSQGMPQLNSGLEVSRDARRGVATLVLDDFSGGLIANENILDYTRYKNRFLDSDGCITHIPGILTASYKMVTDLSSAVDVSAARAANKRVHGLMYNDRFYAFVPSGATGYRLVRDTSTSDPTLASVETYANLTVTAAARLRFNNTDYLCRAMARDGGGTQTVQGTTDPTGSPPTWSEVLTLSNASDRIEWMFYSREWDLNFFGGVFAGVQGVFYCSTAESLGANTTASVRALTYDRQQLQAAQNNPVHSQTRYPRAVTTAQYIASALGGTGAPIEYGTVDGGITVSAQALWATDGNLTNAVDDGTGNSQDDTNYVTLTWTGVPVPVVGSGFSDPVSDLLIFYDWRFEIPPFARVVGLKDELDVHEIGTGNVVDALVTAGTRIEAQTHSHSGAPDTVDNTFFAVGLNKALSTGWGATDTDFSRTYGGEREANGANVKPEEANNSGFSLALQIRFTDELNAKVDAARRTVYYQIPGRIIKHNTGSWSPGPMPTEPNKIPIIPPTANDPTGITKARELLFLEIVPGTKEDDPGPYGRLTAPYTGINNIHDACHFQGGLALAGGGTPADLGLQLKLIDSTGETRDLAFPGLRGGYDAVNYINYMVGHGNVLLYELMNSTGANNQIGLYYNGRHHLYGERVNNGTSLPLPWAERSLHRYQNRMYWFRPISTTSLAAYRQFIPTDMFADPLLVNTTELKAASTTPTLTLPNLDIGPVEANKAILALQCQSLYVSPVAGSYGTVTVRFTDPVAGLSGIGNTTFSDGSGGTTDTFAYSNVVSSGPGVAYRALQPIISFTLSGAKTAQALPIVAFFSINWPLMLTVRIDLAREGQITDAIHTYTQLQTMANTRVVQRFQGAGLDIPCVIQPDHGVVMKFKQGTVGTIPPTWDMVSEYYVILEQTVGATT